MAIVTDLSLAGPQNSVMALAWKKFYEHQQNLRGQRFRIRVWEARSGQEVLRTLICTRPVDERDQFEFAFTNNEVCT